ncbi:hypothetical protein ACJX0J_012609, partial [Zea mays]
LIFCYWMVLNLALNFLDCYCVPSKDVFMVQLYFSINEYHMNLINYFKWLRCMTFIITVSVVATSRLIFLYNSRGEPSKGQGCSNIFSKKSNQIAQVRVLMFVARS